MTQYLCAAGAAPIQARAQGGLWQGCDESWYSGSVPRTGKPLGQLNLALTLQPVLEHTEAGAAVARWCHTLTMRWLAGCQGRHVQAS